MILRGIQIQRCGHDECGLLSDRTLSSNLAELQSSGVLALIRMSICSGVFSLFVPTSIRKVWQVSGWKNRKPIHVRRSKGLVWSPRERVTYVMGILGNRGRPPGDGGDLVCLRQHIIFQLEGAA